ncbi:dethiobiotin synthase [Mucilaginibacter antarcticus]|uniref:ATP-dependent dethiobiotin synthetase BioD n=1 Tax=Mucilaginibacter antarcticus TaxID=1855725 RepID=A0ABW5XQL4_9SPHI
MHKPLFITGIGTGIGKTVISAIMVEHLKADYWKPVQSGDLDNSDTLKVKSLVSNNVSVFHPEAFRLTQPFSPHKAAALDGIVIDPEKIVAPETSNCLVIEGAGGLMVPLNNNFLMVDLIPQLGAEVILVVKHYLGSINHTLLSLDVLKNRNITVNAIIFNGDADTYSEDVIKAYAGCSSFSIPEITLINKENIAKQKIDF